jgi:membrane protein implicated in regulation of membrane protease activity
MSTRTRQKEGWTMGIHEFLQWWNLVYVAPLFVSIIWILGTIFTMGHGDAGHGGHVSHGVENVVHSVAHGVEHGLHHVGSAFDHAIHHGDVSHDGAVHHDVNGHSHHHDSGSNSDDVGRGQSIFTWLINVLGLGQIPITLLIGMFLLCWGAVGMTANQILAGIMKYPAIYIWPSLAVTFFSSFIVTRALVAIVVRCIPETETFGVSRLQLVGSLGKTVFSTSANAGTVDIKDQYGTVHRVQAKTEDGKDAIPSGREVIIIDFDDDDKRFVVRQGTL